MKFAKHLNRIRQFSATNRFSSPLALVFILIFCGLGAYMIITSRAAGPFVSVEPENATRTTNATIGGDNNASGGSFIQFTSTMSYAVPSSIAATCPDTGSTDVSQALNDWIASVPDGSTLVFPAGACYHTDLPLYISNRQNLIVEGNDAKFRAYTDATELPRPAWVKSGTWPRSRVHWNIEASTNITMRNIIVRGANTNVIYDSNLEAQNGFNVGGSNNVLLEDVEVYDVFGDFVYAGSKSKGVTVRRGNFSGAGRQGFATADAEDLLFENFVMTRVARSAVDVEPELDWVVRRVTVRGGTFNAPITNYIFANGGQGSVVEDIRFENNRVIGRPMSALMSTPETIRVGPDYINRVPPPHNRRNYTIINNTSDTATNHPPSFTFVRIDNVLMQGNTQPYTGKINDVSPVGVKMFDSCGVVENNSFPYVGTENPPPVIGEVSGLQPC